MKLIDADKFKEDLLKLWDYSTVDGITAMTVLKQVISDLDNAPTVCGNNQKWCENCISKGKCASTRPHWIKIFENPYSNGYVCSVCGHEIHVSEQFLPKVTECEACGAVMRGDVE